MSMYYFYSQKRAIKYTQVLLSSSHHGTREGCLLLGLSRRNGVLSVFSRRHLHADVTLHWRFNTRLIGEGAA